ncbi:BCAN [Mytilus coruscus]|uniref:BCAN n=1 Tax=Mytilus coruscus TaxID=42192 RepID=A0A6J8DB30_MYTCO|nr:BCAN [Mytilus coruscus]
MKLLFLRYLFTQTALSGRGPLCLSCNKVVQPRDCNHVTACGEHEKCYVQREITDSGIAWYSVGCLDGQHCDVPIGIGKRQNNDKDRAYSVNTMNSSSDEDTFSEDSVILCTSCCSDGDLCNRKGCGSTERLPAEGILCYNCHQQAAPDMCDDITLCGPDKNCYLEQIQIGSDYLFSTKCIHKSACPSSSNTARCCGTELCNDHFLVNTTTHFTNQTTHLVPTTDTPNQTSPSLAYNSRIRNTYSMYILLQETCKRYGQHLPIIENLNEQNFIKSIMEPLHVTLWLDGTDITNEGKWVWYTTGQPIGYFNWSPGQPDHYFGVHGENCMDYGPEYNMQWNDAPCHNNSRKHNVLCEGGFQHWASGEPNDGTEHCLEVVARTQWHWNDGHCEQTGRVNKLVCERYELTAQNVIG